MSDPLADSRFLNVSHRLGLKPVCAVLQTSKYKLTIRIRPQHTHWSTPDKHEIGNVGIRFPSQSASLMTIDKTHGKRGLVQAMIRLVYPAGSTFLPRIWGESNGRGSHAYAYQAHLGIVGVTVGNHRAYSLMFSCPFHMSYRMRLYFSRNICLPCVSVFHGIEYRQSVYSVRSKIGWISNLPECGGPSLGVDLLGLLFGTGEIKNLEMTQVLVGSIQNPTKSHNIGENRGE